MDVDDSRTRQLAALLGYLLFVVAWDFLRFTVVLGEGRECSS
jgi:hypothetical protein